MGDDIRMLTRPRRDSSSSLAAATELKAKKDEIGEPSKIKKETKPKKIKEEDEKSDSGRPLARGVRSGSKIKDEDNSDRSSVSSQDSGELNIKREIKEEIFDEIELEGVKQKIDFDDKKIKKG